MSIAAGGLKRHVGRTLRVIEPTGHRLLLRWRCALQTETRPSLENEFDLVTVWPVGVGGWHYTWTHARAERALDRALRARQRAQHRKARREETVA